MTCPELEVVWYEDETGLRLAQTRESDCDPADMPDSYSPEPMLAPRAYPSGRWEIKITLKQGALKREYILILEVS
jgi:hypothetical protein